MAFKLQLTDEMIRFFRSPTLADADAGCLIRLLIDIADGNGIPDKIPQPLTYVIPIFSGQIESFRESYERKLKLNADRVNQYRRKDVSRITSVTGITEHYTALQALQPLQSITDTRNACNACHSLNQTNTDQTRPDQSKSIQNKPNGNDPTERTDGIPDGINSYDDIFNSAFNPVDMAIMVCNESNPRIAAAGYIKQIKRIGDQAFRVELAAFWGELSAGEEPDHRGRAFSSRLKAVGDYDEAEAEAARRACADLNSGDAEGNT